MYKRKALSLFSWFSFIQFYAQIWSWKLVSTSLKVKHVLGALLVDIPMILSHQWTLRLHSLPTSNCYLDLNTSLSSELHGPCVPSQRLTLVSLPLLCNCWTVHPNWLYRFLWASCTNFNKPAFLVTVSEHFTSPLSYATLPWWWWWWKDAFI